MKRLENKVALITGGSRGIGAAIAKRLANEGANIVLTYAQSADKAKGVIAEIEKAGGKGLAIAANSADPKAILDAVNEAVDRFGRIDTIVSNAGVFVGNAMESYTLDEYEQTMAVNVRAVFFAIQAAAIHMKEGGRVITIGSNMADSAIMAGATLYTMSKSALQGLTKGAARDLGPKGITVNVVQPGPVDTDMNPADGQFSETLKKNMPMGNYGTGDDIAGLVAYLASDESRFVTGSVLTIDGGFNA